MKYICIYFILEFISFDLMYKLYLVFVLDFHLNSSYDIYI